MSSVLGISAFYHDSAAALIIDGNLVGAAQEERFTRIKHDSVFPENSINYLLNDHSINYNSLDYVTFYEKPFIKFERLLDTYIQNSPHGFKSFKTSLPIWLREKLFQKNLILNKIKKYSSGFESTKLLFANHHESHAASAFYPSPFNEACILTVDGVGEWASTVVTIGKNETLDPQEQINFPHSLGLLYSAFTYYLGFKVNSGEYKIMGLAPYGKPIFKNKIKENIISIKKDGSYQINQKYFNYMTGLEMINKNFEILFDHPKRKSNQPLEEFHADVASSIQEVIEDALIIITRNIYNKYKLKNLCMAGGVALNCVANTKILEESGFEDIWVQPAAGDAGCAIGAAYLTYFKKFEYYKKQITDNEIDLMQGSFLGPQFNNNEIEKKLLELGANFEFKNKDKLISETAGSLSNEKIVGWFQGKMEFGPRSLGSRSILADPRSKNMQKNLNLKIKYRESFRPFAASILKEDQKNWFKIKKYSPYMLFVSEINEKLKFNSDQNKIFNLSNINNIRSEIPSVTHVDNSCRIQTVDKETNKMFYNLIYEFKKITDCPLLINTSFNVRGEPIVCSIEDAFQCFMGTEIDILVIENYWLDKKKQSKKLLEKFNDYKNIFELD